MSTRTLPELVNLRAGLISRKIFFDQEIYRRELERIFARCWLFLGVESQIERPGDYMTNYMGEDPVIICRDPQGRVRVFLNSCRHRGMKICRTDRGNAAFFKCPFHGWTYAIDGRLTSVPYLQEAYLGELELSRWGLREVPQVRSYGGLIFGCWDEEAGSLEDYLGNFKWYLDILLERQLGGIEVIPGQQRYRLGANWKIAAENFAGDSYHLPYSHGSAFKLPIRRLNPISYDSGKALYSVALDHGHGIPGGLTVANERYEADLATAKEMGPEVLEYVEESHRLLAERLSEAQVRVYALAFANLFPNFSFNNFSALRPLGLYLWHPKGPGAIEGWQWCAVPRQAPQAVKELARREFSRQQSASGIVAQDDTENFEQVTEATRGHVGQQLDFHYQMGLGHEDENHVEGLPGRFGRYYSEHCQRNFYAYWAELMDVEA